MNEDTKIWLENIAKMSDKEFMKKCESAAAAVLTVWAQKISCDKTDGKKQFCLFASHNWGKAYCDWSDDRQNLFNALKKVGAVNISGTVKGNYVLIEFNKRKRL